MTNKNKGTNTIKGPLVEICQVDISNIPGEVENRKAIRKPNSIFFFTSRANKKILKAAIMPYNKVKQRIVFSISIFVVIEILAKRIGTPLA